MLIRDILSELRRGNQCVVERGRPYFEPHGRLTTSAVTVFQRLRGYQVAIERGKQMRSRQQPTQHRIGLAGAGAEAGGHHVHGVQ